MVWAEWEDAKLSMKKGLLGWNDAQSDDDFLSTRKSEMILKGPVHTERQYKLDEASGQIKKKIQQYK